MYSHFQEPFLQVVLDHPEVADKLLKSNAKVTCDNDYFQKHTKKHQMNPIKDKDKHNNNNNNK